MDWFRNMILFLTAVSLFQWISPGGTFEKYMKYIISLVTMAVILSPLGNEKLIPVGIEIPTEPFSWETEDPGTYDSIEEIQTYQLETILKDRIGTEVKRHLNADFPDISTEDIDVYIKQDSPIKEETFLCIITIRTEEIHRSSEIRSCLENRPEFSGAVICIEGKES